MHLAYAFIQSDLCCIQGEFFQAYKQWAHIDIGMSPIMFTFESISMKHLVILVQTFNLGFNYYFL